MNTDLFIDRSACKCTDEDDGGDCPILVIQHRRGDKIAIRRLSVSEGKDWNLAILSGPIRSPEYTKLRIKEYKHLFFNFRTDTERKNFSQNFDRAKDDYHDEVDDYETQKKALKYAGERPRASSQSLYSPTSPRVSGISMAMSGSTETARNQSGTVVPGGYPARGSTSSSSGRNVGNGKETANQGPSSQSMRYPH